MFRGDGARGNLLFIGDESFWAHQDLFWPLYTSFNVGLVARGVKQRSLRSSFGKGAPSGMGSSAGDTVTVCEAALLRNRVSVSLFDSTQRYDGHIDCCLGYDVTRIKLSFRVGAYRSRKPRNCVPYCAKKLHTRLHRPSQYFWARAMHGAAALSHSWCALSFRKALVLVSKPGATTPKGLASHKLLHVQGTRGHDIPCAARPTIASSHEVHNDTPPFDARRKRAGKNEPHDMIPA